MKTAIAAMTGLAAALMLGGAANAGTPTDTKFADEVSQGGMFEVQAGKLAADKASAQDVRDFGAMEVHDHSLVNDKLKTLTAAQGISYPATLNAKFSAKYAHLQSLSGPAFDDAYMNEMSTLHAGDGAKFKAESENGGHPALRAFAAESHKIVERHIGAIHAATPPAK